MPRKKNLTLKYSKKLGITKREVLGPEGKMGMNYPRAWSYSQDKNYHYLKASKGSIEREIRKKERRNPYSFSF